MTRGMLAVATLLLSGPALAQPLPKVSGSLTGVITGGSLWMYFPVPSPHDPAPNLVGKAIRINFFAETIPTNEYGDPAETDGGFGALVEGVVPQVASGFGGSSFYQGSSAGASFGLGGNQFAFSLEGDMQPNNSFGSMSLTATVTPNGFVNIKGVANGYVETRMGGPDMPYSYDYSIVFEAATADIRLEGLAIPEPATWALMITGFGLAGAAIRRNASGVERQTFHI
jgi:hypothetical protein